MYAAWRLPLPKPPESARHGDSRDAREGSNEHEAHGDDGRAERGVDRDPCPALEEPCQRLGKLRQRLLGAVHGKVPPQFPLSPLHVA